MDYMRLSKKGQLALFVIMGIVLVGATIFLLKTYAPDLNILGSKFSSPIETVSTCIEDSIRSNSDSYFEQNGFLLNSSLLFRYNSQNMPFLCYSTGFYSPCIPQNPLLIESIRKTMENKASRDLSRCLLELKEDYERRGYLFSEPSFDMVLTFNELEIVYSAKMDIQISKGEDVIIISNRNGAVSSVLPKLLRTAETIVNYEASFCEFNHMVWQAINRDLTIFRARAGDQTKVYYVKDRASEKEIKFAIRTCVLPAGI